VPQSRALTIEAVAGACNADVLARKTARNHINKTSPRSAVKTRNVRPNRENRQASIGLALRQNGSAVGITLNCADGSPSQKRSAENASTRACEKSQLT
jgi:hypothetical protein